MELQEIVGSENVWSDQETVAQHARDVSFVCPIRPRAVVKPRNSTEVQTIVRWANETLTPLVPMSSGAPHFRGDTVPGVGGAVIVDLSAMRRIMRVDRRNRVAMIEPGVTFGELIPVLKRDGLAPLIPLVPRRQKSVLTSFLERTPITTPRCHWEPQDPLQCVEVVYGTGDLMRTGSAAFPASLEKQWAVGRAQMRGTGPSQVDFTRLLQGAQGTMGIVTWATIKCKPLAKLRALFLVPSGDVNALIEMAYGITYKKLGEELLILNSTTLASLLGQETGEIEALRARLPPWVLILGIEGAGVLPREKVAYQEGESRDVAQSCGLELRPSIPGASAAEVEAALSQVSGEPYWKLRCGGGCAEVFFLTTLDRSPRFLEAVCGLAERTQYPPENVGVYIQPTVQGTNCHVEFNFTYAGDSRREADRVKQLLEEASELLAEKGAFFSRPYGPWARIAYAGDSQAVIGQRKLKSIFDPNGILNPAKLCF